MRRVLLLASDKGELKGFGDEYLKAITGVGPVMAAATAAMYIERYKPDLVVNVGSAGAVLESLNVGDAYSFSTIVTPDQNLSAFHVKLGSTLDDKRTTVGALSSLDSESGLVLGSSGTFYKTIQGWHKDMSVDSADMEGYGVAVACVKAGVPFLCIKLITDKLGDGSSVGKINFNLRAGRENLIDLVKTKLA